MFSCPDEGVRPAGGGRARPHDLRHGLEVSEMAVSELPGNPNAVWLDAWLAGLLAVVGILSISRQILIATGMAWVLDGVPSE